MLPILLPFPVLIAAFVTFDKLVRLEYSSYKQEWEGDGKPHGFFWIPTESKSMGFMVSFGSSIAFQRRAFSWLFVTPAWMKESDRALRLVFWLRVFVLAWNVGIVISVLTLVFK
jgi:hypothetical protein